MFFSKISIITPVFNNDKDIAACIDSISNQTYKNIEHIIVDGLSTDNSLSIIQSKSQENKHIKFISEKDNGIYDAMNKGIKMATGDYLYFMGSDDVFYNNTVLDDIKNELKDYDLVYGNVFFKYKKIIYDGEFNKNRIMNLSICHQAAIFSKKVFDVVGLYDEKLKLAGDWDVFLRCFFNNHIRIKYVENIICLYNEQGISGHRHEKKPTKYKILYKNLGLGGVLKYMAMQIPKKVSMFASLFRK